MNPRNINRHQSLAGRVNEQERRERERESRAGGSERRNTRGSRYGVSTFVIPTALFITVARFGAL